MRDEGVWRQNAALAAGFGEQRGMNHQWTRMNTKKHEFSTEKSPQRSAESSKRSQRSHQNTAHDLAGPEH